MVYKKSSPQSLSSTGERKISPFNKQAPSEPFRQAHEELTIPCSSVRRAAKPWYGSPRQTATLTARGLQEESKKCVPGGLNRSRLCLVQADKLPTPYRAFCMEFVCTRVRQHDITSRGESLVFIKMRS